MQHPFELSPEKNSGTTSRGGIFPMGAIGFRGWWALLSFLFRVDFDCGPTSASWSESPDLQFRNVTAQTNRQTGYWKESLWRTDGVLQIDQLVHFTALLIGEKPVTRVEGWVPSRPGNSPLSKCEYLDCGAAPRTTFKGSDLRDKVQNSRSEVEPRFSNDTVELG